MVLRMSGIGRFQAVVFALAAANAGFWGWPAFTDWHEGSTAMSTYAGMAIWGGLALTLLCFGVRALRQSVTVTEHGLLVRNVLTTRLFAWTTISGFAREPTTAWSGVWWGVQVLFRNSDRLAQLQASFSREPEEAAKFAERLRALAPADASTRDCIPPPRTLPAAPLDPSATGHRRVFYSWAYYQGGPVLALLLWASCALFAIVVGVTWIVRDERPVVGMLLIAASCLLTVLVLWWARPRLVVSSHGLRTGRLLTTHRLIPWTDVRRVRLIETANEMLTKRCSYLELDTNHGPVPLWATLRRSSQIEPVCRRVMAMLRQPPKRYTTPSATRTADCSADG